MKATEISIKNRSATDKGEVKREQKPRFRPAEDDTKPVLQDPVLSFFFLIIFFLVSLSTSSF